MNIYKSLFLWKMEDMISMFDKTYYNEIELDRRKCRKPSLHVIGED